MNKKILVMDDDAGLRTLLEIALKRKSFVVVTTSSVQEAKAKLAKEQFDLVFADLNLPGVSGLSLVEEVRKHSPSTAFLMSSGDWDPQKKTACLSAGVDSFLHKPFAIEECLAQIEQTIKEKKR